MSEPRAVPEASYADIGDGLRVHYHEAGPAGGEPVVFLHGSGPGASGWSNFKGNLPFVAAAGYRCLVPDVLGFGYSSKPEGIDYDFAFLGGGLERFLAAAGVTPETRCAVVGNSMGGALAIHLALTRPDLVSRLILMAPGGLEERATYMAMAGIQTMVKVMSSKQGITERGMREIFSLQLYDPSALTDETLAERMQIAALQPRGMLARLRVPPLADRLDELPCPVFGLWGRDDQFCPVSGATTLAMRCPDVRVMTLSRCGHWVMVEHEALFNRLCVDFLDNG